MNRPLLLGSLTLSLSSPALAHPAHGAIDAGSLWHYLSDPFHAGLIVMGAVATTALAVLLRRGRPAL